MAENEVKVNERVARLREKMLCIPEVCIERGYLWTESYQETESEPVVIRRAKALKKVLEGISIHIDDDELLVGRATSKMRGGPLLPEFQWEWYLREMDTISTREWDRFGPLAEVEKAQMKEFLPYWKGKTLYERWHTMIPPEALRLHNKIEMLTATCGSNMHFCHIAPDYAMVTREGLSSVIKRIQEKQDDLVLADINDFIKSQFLSAAKITVEAAIGFAQRYSQLGREMAVRETDPRRKAELEEIEEICRQVPANPARNLREALQAVWFIYIVTMIEGWGNGLAIGRADQYLYPFYRRDINEGKITREDARELIAMLYIKLNGLVVLQDGASVKFGGGFPNWANITLGGVTPDGRSAVNELSYMFLDVEKDVRLSAPDIIVRVHKTTPDAFVIKACEVAAQLRGKIKFLSDETAILQLLNDGKPVEYARDYIITGCNTPTVGGRSHDLPGGMFNMPLMVELALNNGVSRMTGEPMGPPTGDPRKFKSYEEVWNAYKQQVEALLPAVVLFRNTDKQVYMELAPVPFLSALFPSCIESGTDITAGGTAPYLARAISLGALPNVGDSLAAVKKVVFEEKKITMAELIDALDRNFNGAEHLLHLLKSAPKFGNDDDYVDTIVNEALVHASNVVARYKGIAGALSNAGAGIGTGNLPLGYLVGALPDGRKACEPLSEGGISPYQGRNVNGPTATMRSVAKLNHLKLTNGSVFNMRFNPEALNDESKIRKFASLIRTYCETGGFLVQFNIVSTAMLRDAQQHPEKYRDLLVRVATYSAYFVELNPELQNDIIARTEFQES
jgi:formate C-acetyltransferase